MSNFICFSITRACYLVLGFHGTETVSSLNKDEKNSIVRKRQNKNPNHLWK